MTNWLKRKALIIWNRFFKPPKQIKEEGQPVILPILNRPGQYIFYCPGCADNHTVATGSGGHVLTGSKVKPTIKPSVLSEEDEAGVRCHSWITNGRIRFLYDCTHRLAGKTVDLPHL